MKALTLENKIEKTKKYLAKNYFNEKFTDEEIIFAISVHDCYRENGFSAKVTANILYA